MDDTTRSLPAGTDDASAELGPPETAAGYSIHMIRPHLRDIPPTGFPPGFGIRTMRPEEGHLWLAVERDAETYLQLADDAFEKEFGRDLASVPQRCFLLTGPDEQTPGTVSAWYYTYRGEEFGLIHWIAVRPAFQGRGLGKAALCFALRELARWHTRALLGTQTRRIPAIRMYLDHGFEPDMEEDRAAARWRHVAAHLDHPVLRRLGL